MAATFERKLTTILAADAAGYSRAMERDEIATMTALRDAKAVFAKFIERHRGRIANTAGDGLIAEFPSVVEAVQCAVEVQSELGRSRNALGFRIGVHLGDVMVDGEDLLGEGVNLAARLQSLADPGGILISQQVYDQVHSKLGVQFDYLGARRPKNIDHDVPVYRVSIAHARPAVARTAEPPPLPQPSGAPDDDELLARTRKRALRFAGIWGLLLAIDLTTGPGFWAHWPGLVIAALVAWHAAPLAGRAGISRNAWRAAIAIAVLILINLFSWSGVAWALWPIGAMAGVWLVHRLFSARSRQSPPV